MNDVMIRNCHSGQYLSCICFGRFVSPELFRFVPSTRHGYVFENEEEAQATIDFISNVIDFETAECLEIVIVP